MSESAQELNAATSRWYNANPELEDGRLRAHRIEFEVTLRSILAHLPDRPGLKILDIGGGTGPYTFALAARGHTLTLVDLSQGLLDIALSRAASLPSTSQVRILQGDATRLLETAPELAPEAGSFDAVLLLGPLYHIMSPALRDAALANAWAMVRPAGVEGGGGGVLAAAWVSRYAHFRDVATRDPARLVARRAVYAQHARDGCYVRTEEGTGRAYLAMHHELPEEMPRMLRRVTGAAEVKMVGTEGVLTGGLDRVVNELEGEVFETWVQKCLEVGSDEHAWLMSDHIIGIAHKS